MEFCIAIFFDFMLFKKNLVRNSLPLYNSAFPEERFIRFNEFWKHKLVGTVASDLLAINYIKINGERTKPTLYYKGNLC